jgi:uncharacterized repeat protein (TIGR01451 family)
MPSVSRCVESGIAAFTPAVVAAGLLVCASPAAAQYSVSESFRNATAPGWVPGGSARLTAAAPAIDAAGDGWLRLTDAVDEQAGFIHFDTAIPAAQGFHIEFEYAMYDSTSTSAGEGLSFFMFDGATVPFSIGSFGGSLGYAQRNPPAENGLSGGYFGVGIDLFGKYSTATEGRDGGLTTLVPNAAAIRGSGGGQLGYSYVVDTGTLALPINTSGRYVVAGDAQYRKVLIDAVPSAGALRVSVRLVRGTTIEELIPPTSVGTPPATVKLGFAAATSTANNIHEIRNLQLTQLVDLGITKTMVSLASDTITYEVVVSNDGPGTEPAAIVSDPGAAGLAAMSWNCVASGGATCTPNGTGALDTTASLPPGGRATYTIKGTLGPLTVSPLVNTATVTASAAGTELDPTDNEATDTHGLNADLSITKQGAGTYTPGAPYTYHLDVFNGSSLWVYGARVEDTLPAGLSGTWQCAVLIEPAICTPTRTRGTLQDVVDLGPGSRVRYTLVVNMPSSSSTPVVNTATVAVPATWMDPNAANDTSMLTSQPAPSADLSVSKSSNPNPYVPGAPLTYTVVVSNAGPSDIVGALVQDSPPADVTGITWVCSGVNGGVCPASGVGSLNEAITLPEGGIVTFVLTGTAPASPVQLQNTVTVALPQGATDPAPGNNSSIDSNPILPLADLTITKSGTPNPYAPGQPITYTITVTNLGPADVSNARVQDVLPPELAGPFSWTCAASGPGASCVPAGTGSIDTLVSLASGTSVVFTLTGPAPPTAQQDLANTATVTAPADVTDLVPGNNRTTTTTPAPLTANLRLSKTSLPTPYIPAAPILTTIIVSNDGPDDVVNARVLDIPPPGLTESSWQCVATGGGACGVSSGAGHIDTFVTLPSGAVATFTISSTAPTTPGVVLVNTATVTPPAGVFDPNPADNEHTDANPVSPAPDLQITKQALPASYTPGQPLTYTLVVTSNGPDAATIARVQDALHPSLAGFTWTCTGVAGGASCGRGSGVGPIDVLVTLPMTGARVRFDVTGAVPLGAVEPLENTASVSAPRGLIDPVPANNSVRLTVQPVPLPDLRLTKTSVPLFTYHPGSPLGYVLAIANQGAASVPAGAYTVTDTLPAALSGATWTCTVQPSGTCSVSGGALTTAALPAIAPGATVTIRLQTFVPVTMTAPLTNTAAVVLAAGLIDRNPANNTATRELHAAPLFSAGIVGVVTDSDGAPLAGVTMQLTGVALLETQTAADGTFAFPGLPSGHDYTVTPVATAYVFSPASRTIVDLEGERHVAFVGLVEPYRRYFPEGASGPFFSTVYSLANPTGHAARVSFRFQRPEESEITYTMTLPPGENAVVDPATLAGLEATAFSTVIDADRQIVAARTMVWDRSGYGTHRGTGVATPRTTWFIAEGATLPGFSLFYLIQNPGDTPAIVTVRYLLQAAGSTPVLRTYEVGPRSRFTVGVHDDPALANQEISAAISTDGTPIVVERAMYRSGPRMFEAGAAVTAAPAPVSRWYFGEGATGPYFDMFLLMANPGAISLTATVQYLLPDGGVIVRRHDLPAGSRRTVWVDFEDPQLADTAVGMVVDASGPIVAERAMWWPGSADTWSGGHASLGATNVAPRWGITGMEAGGSTNTEPWILVANPSETATVVRLTLLFPDGRPPMSTDYPVPAQGRFTIDVARWHPETANASFGAVVEQLGDPTGIIVESSTYSDSGGARWAAGRGGVASPIP